MDWLKLWRRAAEPDLVVEDATDARRAGGQPRPGEPDPDDERRSKNRRRAAIFAFSSVFVAGLAMALLGQGGLRDLIGLWRQHAEMQRQVGEQRERVEALGLDLERLRSNPMALERIAREELGYARPGEVTFLLPEEEEDPQEPGQEQPAPAP